MRARQHLPTAPSRRVPVVVTAVVAILAGALSMAAAVAVAPAPAGAAGDTGMSSISTGSTHACGVTAAGAAYCWGGNADGQLGDGSTTSSIEPVPVWGLTSGVTSISVGTSYSCAVRSGAAYCWGRNSTGQLGDGSTTGSLVPVRVSGLPSGVAGLSAGRAHACALVSGGAWCWGENQSFQLGNTSSGASNVPVAVFDMSEGVTAISAGGLHSCAVQLTGVYCWGRGAEGQLGTGSTTASQIPAPVSGMSGVTAIAAGTRHTCAIKAGGAWCWGENTEGRLGNGSTTSSSVPVAVSGLSSGVTAISAGGGHSCAVRSGAPSCWGSGLSGQLGDDGFASSSVPVAVLGLSSGVTAISAGSVTTCAVASAVASCWGLASSGVLGYPAPARTAVALPVPAASSGVTALDAGPLHTCAVVAAGAKCWGYNGNGQVGAGSSRTRMLAPTDVAGLSSGVTAIAGGLSSSCAVRSGAAWCWGDNGSGQLGDGSTMSSNVPVPVSGLAAGVTQIAVGYSTSCAVVSGAAHCWGSNTGGMLGNGSAATSSNVPVPVTGLSSGVTAIAVGSTRACAVMAGGAWCWGTGPLGDASGAASSVPVPVSGLSSGVTAIDVGNGFACAVASGAARCWGANGFGTLGDGTTTNSDVPVPVSGLSTGATAISAGSASACAVVAGAGRCWGRGLEGQLGNGTQESSLTPVPVSGLSGATAITVGQDHACALAGSGVACWGSSAQGQLGLVNPYVPNPVVGGRAWGHGVSRPIITGSRSPLPNGYGWNKVPVTVTFDCISASLVSCTSPVTVSADGAGQSVTGTAVDSVDQTTSATVSPINIDRVPPTLAGVAATPPNAAGWYSGPVSMTWTCTDALSGLPEGACPSPSSTVGEGTAVSVTRAVEDRARNATTASSEQVQIDATKPSTGLTSPPTWSTTDVTLTLLPADALSRVASTSYRIDGGPTQSGTAPKVSGAGTHTVQYWSTDVAGNVEAAKSAQVRIDTSAPSITADVSPAPNAAGWNRTPVTVSFVCGDEDGGSAVASCSAPVTFSSQVDTTTTGTATDTAGNTASVNVPVRIDLTAPTVTADVPAANANGWFAQPVQVPFSCTDAGGSGVASCPEPVVFAGDGADQPVTGTATDGAGNTGSASGATVSLDQVAPTISGAVVGAADSSGRYVGPVTVRWTCEDALSGIVSCPADVAVSGEGVHQVTRSVTDRAGNTTSALVTVRIDRDTSNDPGIVHGVITDARSGAVAAGVVVTLRTPSNAIVATTTTGTDGTYTFPVVADGSYKIYAVLNKVYLGAYHPRVFPVARGTSTAVDLALSSTVAISGTVRTAGGAPIPGATVRVAPSGLAAVTDADGNYRISGNLPGPITVRAVAHGSVPSAPASLTLTSDRTVDITLADAEVGGGLKGTITAQANGAPLAGASVRVWAKDATAPALTVTTGTDGRFDVASLPVGTYEIDVVRGDYQVRWFGDSLSRSGAAPVTITTGCAAAPDPAWGDPCAVPVSIALRR